MAYHQPKIGNGGWVGIPVPVLTGRLLRFDRLDTSGSRVPVYTVGWRIVDEPNDAWTKRFLAFKQDHSKGFMGGAFLMKEAVREVVSLERLSPSSTGISIALSSRDTEVNTNSVLCRTGSWIAKQLNLADRTNLFSKQVHRSLHSLNSSGDRDREVSGKYRAKPLHNVTTLIILDDFVTRGATFGEMQRALAATGSKVKVIGLAMGKNEKSGYASRFGYSVHNSHIPPDWNDLWRESAKRGGQ